MNWWEHYKILNSALFTKDNSGRYLRVPIPYSEYMDGGLKPIIGVSSMFNILGYTLNPPFKPEYESVAIMFENNETFEKIWFHFVK